jgi:membrane protease YdiL (CAAX protease family)
VPDEPAKGEFVGVIGHAVLAGMLVVMVGTIPRNIAFFANFRYFTSVPWAVPLTAVYLWYFWRYVRGEGPPDSTAETRRVSLRANHIPREMWAWALVAGGLGIVTLVFGLRAANRLITLPPQQLPDLTQVPSVTVFALLLMGAPVAGVIEESAFRGYMQGPIERRFGIVIAILITGTMFAVAHLDFTLILWPYYVAVAAIYGMVTYLTDSILPSIVLHTGGNVFSNTDLWMHGQAEWQTSAGGAALIWQMGPDPSFWLTVTGFVVAGALTVGAYIRLAQVARHA